MRHIAFLIGLLALSQAKGQTKDDFNNFQKSIAKYKNCYQIGDTISCNSNIHENTNFIELNFLRKYPFVDTLDNNIKFKFKTLKEYRCSLISQFKFKNINLFLTHSYSTAAGDGLPTLTLTTFSNQGEFIDIIRFSLQCLGDPWTEFVNKVSISSDFVIFFNQTTKDFKIIEEKNERIPIKSAVNNFKYLIDGNGYFKRVDI